MQSWSWRPPAFVPCEVIPVSDRGFRYGMAVFESVRVSKGRALFADAHAARLETACKHRGFHFDRQMYAEAMQNLQKQGHDGFARLYVTAGDGSVADPALSCRVFLMLENRSRPHVDAYDVALPLDSHQAIFGGLKTANYWPNIDALQRAVAQGKQEAILFNEHGELFSACMGNVFVISNGEVKTPNLACGARDGVIREWVSQQVPVRETSIFLADVRAADELFITNSWIGVMPVASLDSRKLPSRAIGTKLQDALEREIAAQVR
jgi:4-amino-4-deoxychorismate lyase